MYTKNDQIGSLLTKSKLLQLLLYFLLFLIMASSSKADCTPKSPPPDSLGNPCYCHIPYMSDIACNDGYLVNGCFECYDFLWCSEGRESDMVEDSFAIGLLRNQAQFENALGGVDRSQSQYTPPKVPIGDDRILLNGWYSPTNYSPNYFNFANDALLGDYQEFFSVGHNWLNRENAGYDLRYPDGWILDELENIPIPAQSHNYGYVGFYTENPKSKVKRQLEYIQQRLKKPLLYNNQGDPIIYEIKFLMSKNHNQISGSQRIGAYFSKTAPINYDGFGYDNKDTLNPIDYMAFTSKAIPNGTLVLVGDSLNDESVIGVEGGQFGINPWVEVRKQFYVTDLANYITIGLFSVPNSKGEETNFNDYCSSNETAYYIDNVSILQVSDNSTLCGCTNANTKKPTAEIDIIPVERIDSCCFRYFFNQKANLNCTVTFIQALVKINGVERRFKEYNYNPDFSNKDFYFGDTICFSEQELSGTPEHPDPPEIVFSFNYVLNGNSVCNISDTFKLACHPSCVCQTLPNQPPYTPILIVKDTTKACCYDIELKLNDDNSLEKFCKYNRLEVLELITNGEDVEEKLLFYDIAGKENGILENNMWYYNPTKAITISNKELCFDPIDLQEQPTKVIKLRLHNMETNDSCEYTQTIELDCPISCSDLAGLSESQQPALELNITPTSKNQEGDCCYQVSLINNTGFNIKIPAIEITFSSQSGVPIPDFGDYGTTTIDSAWEHEVINESQIQNILIKPAPNSPNYISPGPAIHLIDICIPESDSKIDVESYVRDLYSTYSNNCLLSKLELSCPSDGCNCDYSLLDFKLTALQNSSAEENCCYKVTITPQNEFIGCDYTLAKVFVRQPGQEYSLSPTFENSFTGGIHSDYTFNDTICIIPDGDSTAFSVKIEFVSSPNDSVCVFTKDFKFADCPCTCDASGLDFEFVVNPPGSCCYDIYLSSDCTRLFSEFNIEFPSTFSDHLNKILFTPKTNDIRYMLVPNSNVFTYKPKIPVTIFRDTRIYIGSFCLPQTLANLLPQSISVTAKDKNGDTCKVQSLNMTCSCCDGATVTVVSLGNCVWDIIINNISDCWLINYGIDHYSYINDITKPATYGQPSPMPVPSSWTKRFSLTKGDYRTLEIVWAIKGLPICSKIITLDCTEILNPTADEGYKGTGSNHKEVIPFTNVNMGVIEDFQFTPNPASTEATISYDLLSDVKNVSLAIYNIKGDLVANIPVSNFSKGQNNINLNTTNINSGSYYLVLIADNAKMCLPIRIVR